MSNQLSLSRCVRYALTVCSCSALLTPMAYAQDAGQAGSQSQVTTTQLEKVQVTGTRILRTNVETAQPITVITSKQIQESGLTTIGDVLSNISQASASFNNQINNSIGGQATSTIDLRYFGSNRLLVLVDGQRWTQSLDGSVDLNTIPSSVIDHVEILQDGASAIYGSDAITGVVNIITVKNFQGAEANAYLGMYNAHNDGGGWDGKQQSYSYTMGFSGARGGVVINARSLSE